MKYLKTLGVIIVAFVALGGIGYFKNTSEQVATAATILYPIGGGTGTSTIPTLGQFLVATSTGTYEATTTVIGIRILNSTTTSATTSNLSITGNSTTTFASGITITTGCYAVATVCIGSSFNGGVVTGSTTFTGGLIAATGNNTISFTVTGTSSLATTTIASTTITNANGTNIYFQNGTTSSFFSINGSSTNATTTTFYYSKSIGIDATTTTFNFSKMSVSGVGQATTTILAIGTTPGGPGSYLYNNGTSTLYGHIIVGSTSTPSAMLTVLSPLGNTTDLVYSFSSTTPTGTTTFETLSSAGERKVHVATTNLPNMAFGTSTMIGGTVTVSNNLTKADSLIFLSICLAGGTLGNISVGTRVAGTSFVINSSSVVDTSTICWSVYNPIY